MLTRLSEVRKVLIPPIITNVLQTRGGMGMILFV